MGTDSLMQRVPVWTWRDAIRKADVAPLTKLVLYSIANYLSDVGEGCYPRATALMADTGLSNRSLATHLQQAVAAGLLAIARETGADGRFKRTLYRPRFPDHCDLPREPARAGVEADDKSVSPGDGGSPGPGEGGSPGAGRVKEVHAARPREGGSSGPGEPDAAHRVNLLHAELSKEELSNTPPIVPPAGGDGGGGEPAKAPERAERRRRGGDDVEAMLERLVLVPTRERAVDLILGPLVRQRAFDAPAPEYALGQLADWLAGRQWTDADAKRIVEGLLAKRRATIRQADVQDMVTAIAARPDGRVSITRSKDPEAVAAWLAYARARRTEPSLRTIAYMLTEHGMALVPSRLPPASEGRAA